MAGIRTTHDVKIGDDYFLVRPGSFRQRAAQQFGPRFTTGDPDYNNLAAWQHWVQSCWVGGVGAETWQDDAMVDECVGVDMSQHDVLVLARDLGPGFADAERSSDNWDLNGEVLARRFQIFDEQLYCLQTDSATASRLYRFNEAAGGSWTLVKTFTERVRFFAKWAGYLVFGDAGTTMQRMDDAEAFTTFDKPDGISDAAYAMRSYRDRLYVGFGREIWRLKRDFTWDGSTAFYEASGVTFIDNMEVHQGFLYMGSNNGHILRTDGNNTFDMWDFDPHVKIASLRSFDGRLFIGTTEDLPGTSAKQAVLYQFSGAAVTELKRWGKVGYDITPGTLRAFEGSLFFGASSVLGMGDDDGFGIARYDPKEDAFHIFASSTNSNFAAGTEGINNNVDDVMFFKGKLFCSVRGHGIFYTPWTFKDVTRFQAKYDTTRAGAGLGGTNGGWYTSSDFDAGTPGLEKLWNAVKVHVDLPTTDTSVFVEYSVDGGINWHDAGSVEKTDPNRRRYARNIILEDADGDPVKATRIKLRITLRTEDFTRSPQVRSVVVRYLPIPEPNWMWDMTLVLSEKQELLDGTIEEPDSAAKLTNLRTAFREQELVNFVTPDGDEYATGDRKGVLIFGYEERFPNIDHEDAGELEREVVLTLLEMIETYEP